VEVQWCMQLRHPNRPVDLNLVPTWPDQFDQALAIYFHCSTLRQHEKPLFNSLTTWKNQRPLPFYPLDKLNTKDEFNFAPQNYHSICTHISKLWLPATRPDKLQFYSELHLGLDWAIKCGWETHHTCGVCCNEWKFRGVSANDIVVLGGGKVSQSCSVIRTHSNEIEINW